MLLFSFFSVHSTLSQVLIIYLWKGTSYTMHTFSGGGSCLYWVRGGGGGAVGVGGGGKVFDYSL